MKQDMREKRCQELWRMWAKLNWKEQEDCIRHARRLATRSWIGGFARLALMITITCWLLFPENMLSMYLGILSGFILALNLMTVKLLWKKIGRRFR